MKHRKPRRPDWRSKPSRRMIAAFEPFYFIPSNLEPDDTVLSFVFFPETVKSENLSMEMIEDFIKSQWNATTEQLDANTYRHTFTPRDNQWHETV